MIDGLQSQEQVGLGRHETTRAIDTAVGILVGWRQCSTYTAFRELLSASERHRIPLFAMAGALVNLASSHANSQPVGTAAELSAEREWEQELLAAAEPENHSIRREVDRWL